MEYINKGKVILVTGGSRSGKSEFAEELLKDKSNVLYIATAIAADDEMKNRIFKHKERRNASWETFEGYKELTKIINTSKKENILLDCVTIMLTNLMFDNKQDFDKMSMEDIEVLLRGIKEQFYKLIEAVRKNNKLIILVTNEVGYGIVPEHKLSRIFRDLAGSLNQYIGSLSDELYLVACGVPLKLK